MDYSAPFNRNRAAGANSSEVSFFLMGKPVSPIEVRARDLWIQQSSQAFYIYKRSSELARHASSSKTFDITHEGFSHSQKNSSPWPVVRHIKLTLLLLFRGRDLLTDDAARGVSVDAGEATAAARRRFLWDGGPSDSDRSNSSCNDEGKESWGHTL